MIQSVVVYVDVSERCAMGFNKSPALPMAWSWRGKMADVSLQHKAGGRG